MASKAIKSVRGMHEVLPGRAGRYSLIQQKIIRVIQSYAYDEIRIPMLEYTELFARGVGESTDIVEKEMYSLSDGDGVSLSLRPEGTAGCVRALEENGLLYNQSQKVFYSGPMFRYEKPQKGRYRQFNQIGVETYGFGGPDIDIELILMARDIWRELEISEAIVLELNNLGSEECRRKYKEALVEFLTPLIPQLDEDSKRRVSINPLRILDSKSDKTQELLVGAPMLNDFSDGTSQQKFEKLCSTLDELGLDYVVNPFLVRGLDYYTGCVFEWKAQGIGAQNTVCAGGRYDGLVQKLGGRQMPAMGFAIGLERLILLCEEASELPVVVATDVYICLLEDALFSEGIKISERMRASIPAAKIRLHMGGGNLKKQMKRADASGAEWAVLIGRDEIEKNLVSLKHLRDHGIGQSLVTPDEAIKKIMSKGG